MVDDIRRIKDILLDLFIAEAWHNGELPRMLIAAWQDGYRDGIRFGPCHTQEEQDHAVMKPSNDERVTP